MRELSAFKDERKAAEQKFPIGKKQDSIDKNELIKNTEQALYFAFITTYAQGMVLLQHASKEYQYDLKMADIAAIWRGGCIIRATLLEKMQEAYNKQSALPNLLVDDFIAAEMLRVQSDVRSIIQTGVLHSIPLAAFSSALVYFDSYRRGWLPTNLIQAQRDYFGAHTYERTDRPGIFHTHWD
jgi:6-phosphogluconate dehydrogenase